MKVIKTDLMAVFVTKRPLNLSNIMQIGRFSGLTFWDTQSIHVKFQQTSQNFMEADNRHGSGKHRIGYYASTPIGRMH